MTVKSEGNFMRFSHMLRYSTLSIARRPDINSLFTPNQMQDIITNKLVDHLKERTKNKLSRETLEEYAE